MNRLGGRSNSGEGGEDVKRFEHDPNGDWRRSAVKQVASARFGVTAHYLTNCFRHPDHRWPRARNPVREASFRGTRSTRGSPGVRHSTPGVGLISPPPHHDIYSIEDLAQLIHDLKNRQPVRAGPRQAGLRERGRPPLPPEFPRRTPTWS